MSNWVDRLISEYSEEKKQLSRLRNTLDRKKPVDREDLKEINSMIADMDFVIEWLETGRQPGTLKGIDKRAVYQMRYLEDMDFIPDITSQLDLNEKKLYLSEEKKRVLINLFSSFSYRERQCYLLHIVQGMSMSEIAKQLGIKKRTVQQYIERARKKVEQRVS